MNFYIYDLEGNRTTTLSGDSVGKHTAVIEAKVEEKLETFDQLFLNFVANTSDYDKIQEGYAVVFKDIKGWKEYLIGLVEDEDDEGVFRNLTANISSIELQDEVVLEQYSGSYKLDRILELLLKDTRFDVGHVDNLNNQGIDFETQYRTVAEVLEDVSDLFDVELISSYDIDSTRITRRRINAYEEYGDNGGKVFELEKDVTDIKRTVNAEGVKTSIVPLGKEPQEETDDDGNKYQPDRLTIKDEEWDEEAGDPSTKPKGQLHLTHYEALAEYGYGKVDNKRPKLIVEEFDIDEDEEDESDLIQKGWERLEELVQPEITYEATVNDLYILSNEDPQFEHEQVGLGDFVAVRDFNFYTPMLIRNRITEMERDLLVPINNVITLGEGIKKFRSSEKIQEVEEQVKEQSNRINTVQDSANGKNKVYRGPDDPKDLYDDVSNGDLWFKPTGDGETELYVLVDGEWDVVIDPNINEEIKKRIEDSKEIAEKARDRADEASDRVQQAIDDAKKAYDYADSAIKEAGGKNTVYRGTSIPDDGEKNDILFLEDTSDGETTTKMYVHDGSEWVLRSHDASGLGGTLDLSQLNVINLNMDSATGGSLHLDRGLKVENNGQEVLVAEKGNVTMDVDNLLIKSKDVSELMETSFYQEAEAVGMVYKENGQTKAIIGIEEGKPYIKGEHIILDGDTIVDGSFTVTDEIFAEEMNISKFTTGTLNAKDVRIINLDVDQLVGNKSNFVESAWNGINSDVSINGEEMKVAHHDGTYTSLGKDGLKRFTSHDSREYHYLLQIRNFTYGKSSKTETRWIQLADDFKGKNFRVYFAIADSLNAKDYHYALQRFVCTVHPNFNIDYENARVPVIAYKSETKSDGHSPKIRDVQGIMLALY